MTAITQQSPRGRWPTTGVIGSMLLAGGLTALAVSLLMRTPPPRVMRLALVTAPSVAPSLEQPADVSVGIAPDGSWIAYVGNRSTQLFLRRHDSNDPKAIVTTPAELRGVFVSDDGHWIGYVEGDRTLRKVPSSGGSPSTIATMDGVSRGAAWSTKRGIVFATDNAEATGLQHVDPSGGPVTVLTRPDSERGERDHVFPRFLPDDRHVLFTILAASGGLDASQVAVLDLETGAWKSVFRGGYNGRFAPSGHLLYVTGGALRAVAFDPSRLEVRGAPVQVAPRLFTGDTGAAAFDVASDGTLAYLDATTDRSLVWVGRNGREEAVLDVPRGSYITPRISPDGAHLAVSEAGDLWLVDLAVPLPTRKTRVTFSEEMDWFPVWTPDGRRLVFGSRRDGGVSNLYVQSVAGGASNRLTESPDFHFPTGITPDGGAVVFHTLGSNGESEAATIRRVQLDPPHAADMLIDLPHHETNAEISPDGRWLAYEGGHAARPGQVDVYVRPFPDVDAGQRQVSSQGGIQPVWARNGQELFYRELDGTVMAARVAIDGAMFGTQKPVRLFRGPYVTRSPDGGRTYDVSTDGERFLMIKEESDPELPPPHIVVVLHAGEELERLAP